ncbi:MAG TPA: hypothetical protein VKY59_17970 [Spirillospora sp.]|nr:hypothetical protein [Spirillospora sp.]
MTNTPGRPGKQPAPNTGSSGSAGGLLSRVNRLPSPASPSTPATSQFASTGLRSRFGANALTWEILPLGDVLVCFSLEGLGGSLRHLIGDDLPDTGGNYDALLQTIENDAKTMNKVRKKLDRIWQGYDLKGAMLVHPWKNTTRDVILASAKINNTRPVFLRAFDPLLVINVLARTRENLLQPRAPLSFDKTYLERTLISDDQRLVRLVQLSGYVEEVVPTPPPLPDDEEAKDE